MNEFIKAAQIEGIKAQGQETINQIQACVNADSNKKAAAIAEVVIHTQLAIVKVMMDS